MTNEYISLYTDIHKKIMEKEMSNPVMDIGRVNMLLAGKLDEIGKLQRFLSSSKNAEQCFCWKIWIKF